MTARGVGGGSDPYGTGARHYVGSTADLPPSEGIDRFVGLLPGRRVLEIGCGGGRDSRALLARGLELVATDASPAIAACACNVIGQSVGVLDARDLSASSEFDGVWAAACLHHLPRADITVALQGIRTALRPDGVAYLSFKSGTADEDGHDDQGRWFSYLDQDRARGLVAGVDELELVDVWSSRDTLGRTRDWTHALCRKTGVNISPL